MPADFSLCCIILGNKSPRKSNFSVPAHVSTAEVYFGLVCGLNEGFPGNLNVLDVTCMDAHLRPVKYDNCSRISAAPGTAPCFQSNEMYSDICIPKYHSSTIKFEWLTWVVHPRSTEHSPMHPATWTATAISVIFSLNSVLGSPVGNEMVARFKKPTFTSSLPVSKEFNVLSWR